MRLVVLSRSAEDTLAVGEAVGRAARPGLVVALQGDLGAGKTVLTKGVARGLGVARWRYVSSPTFTLHNVYRGRLVLHHVDLYRMGGEGDLEGAGLVEVLYGPGVCVIEWPDRFFAGLPEDRLTVRFEWGAGDKGRTLELTASGPVSRGVLGAVPGRLQGLRWREDVDDLV